MVRRASFNFIFLFSVSTFTSHRFVISRFRAIKPKFMFEVKSAEREGGSARVIETIEEGKKRFHYIFVLICVWIAAMHVKLKRESSYQSKRHNSQYINLECRMLRNDYVLFMFDHRSTSPSKYHRLTTHSHTRRDTHISVKFHSAVQVHISSTGIFVSKQKPNRSRIENRLLFLPFCFNRN